METEGWVMLMSKSILTRDRAGDDTVESMGKKWNRWGLVLRVYRTSHSN